MNYLNLGCGDRFHPDWINVDFTPTKLGIIGHNLTEGIPFFDDNFDVVYHSHLLEHFSKSEAVSFLKECYQVLRPQGIIRIAVPDLEQIVRGYLFALEQALSHSHEAADNYNWMLLELFDQMVRNQSGGEMLTYLHQENIPNESFVLKRLGIEAKKNITSGRQAQQFSLSNPWFKRILRPIYRFLHDSHFRREVVLKQLLSSDDYHALQIGWFRKSGEIHQWMYDRYSLSKLLKETGFTKITQRTAIESYVPNWTSFNLDTEPDGSVYKPDSLFIEAIKPNHEYSSY